MTLDEARKILADCQEYIGEIYAHSTNVVLDGTFTVEQLQAVIVILQEREALAA